MHFSILNYANCLIEDMILIALWRMIDDKPFRFGNYAAAYMALAFWSVLITLIDSVLFSLLPVNFLMVFSCLWMGFRRPFKDTIGRALFAYLVLLFLQCAVLCVIPGRWFGTNTGNFLINGTVLVLSILGVLIGRRQRIQVAYVTNVRMFWAFLLILCVPEIVLVQTVVTQYGTQSSLVMLLLFLLLLLVIAFELLAFSRKVRQVKTQQLSSIQKYINDMNSHLEESRRSIHDFNKHLRYVRNMVAERSDNAELVEDVDAYCEQMLAIYDEEEILLQLDDPVLRAILYGRRTQATAHNISFTLKATPVLPTFPLKDYQMVEVLDNLMDNAFECVMARPEGSRWMRVTLSARRVDGCTMQNSICIENPCDDVDVSAITAGKHYTTKSGRHRGIGLKHVFHMVQSTGGWLRISAIDGVFSAEIEYIQKSE